MIRILVADDHQIVRAGLKDLLSDFHDLTIAGEAASGAQVIKMVRESAWDIVLLDVSMPGMNGVDTLKQIKRFKPELPVLIFSMHPEDSYAVNLLRAGASGYLSKACEAAELVAAVRRVLAGRRYISPSLGEQLAGDLNGESEKAPHTGLSEREFQVFCKLAHGQVVSEIADELCLSAKTISTYRTRILEKMGMKTNANLTYYAVKYGLME